MQLFSDHVFTGLPYAIKNLTLKHENVRISTRFFWLKHVYTERYMKNKKILIPIIATAIAAVTGVILFFVLSSGKKSYFNIQVLDTSGTVTVDRDNKEIDAYEGMKMRDKDYIKVSSKGFARISCDRETYSHFEHNSEASFDADSDKKLVINLIKGELVVELRKELLGDEAILVKTPNTTMAIRGTVIAVKTIVNEDGSTKTVNYCLEGKAEVETADGETKTISAGEGRLTVTDTSGEVVENTSAGADDFEFKDIDLESLKGAEDKPMTIRYSDEKKGNTGLAETDIDMSAFPDPIFRHYILDRVDTDKNMILSADELAIDKINVEHTGINDLKGIEYFKNLTYLNCAENYLTSLDVSGNTKLTDLYCGKNLITDLNLSGCGELTRLSCANNSLSGIDLRHNTKLMYLICSDNQINKLDLSNQPDLISFESDNNLLSELDFSNNRKLETVNCFNNLLTKLDIKGCNSLKYIYCQMNFLTSIDVTDKSELLNLYLGNNKLSSIDVSNNTKLTELSIYNNLFTAIDVSNNENLEIFYCDNNDLTEINVRNNPKLRELSCSFTNIGSLDLSNNPNLEGLNCIYTNLTRTDVSNNPKLKDTNYDVGKNELIR